MTIPRKLGLLGSEYTLPSVAIVLPVNINKKVDRAEAMDGSGRYNFGKEYRDWDIRFPKLTKTELDNLTYLRSLNQILRWQNPDESDKWYNVVITEFNFNSEDPASPTVYYFGSMLLEEAI